MARSEVGVRHSKPQIPDMSTFVHEVVRSPATGRLFVGPSVAGFAAVADEVSPVLFLDTEGATHAALDRSAVQVMADRGNLAASAAGSGSSASRGASLAGAASSTKHAKHAASVAFKQLSKAFAPRQFSRSLRVINQPRRGF